MTKSFLLRGATLALSGLLIGGLVGCDRDGGEDGPIRIGVLYPTTGVGQTSGAPALLGHEMMVEKINAEGGLLGRQVVSIHRDSRSDPATATAAARELISRYGVQFLVGGLTSSEGQAISEVARQEGVIYIATIPKAAEITAPEFFHPYVFRTAANTHTEARSAAIIVDQLGYDRICTILFNYSYGHSLDGPFREHIQQIRPSSQIVYQAWPALGTNDYTTYITNILNSGCEVVFSNIWSSNFPAFAKQAQPFGFFNRVQYVSAGEVGTPEISEEMGAEMPEGIWANSYQLFYYPDTPEHQSYVQELSARTGRANPISFPISGYIGMQFLAEAIRTAGTTNTDAVIRALEGLRISTPIGEQTMRASDHQANRGQFWGRMARSNDPSYPFLIMDPVRYIPADDIMD
jgi:branched-chain amino acid transport system substrate-binding protein